MPLFLMFHISPYVVQIAIQTRTAWLLPLYSSNESMSFQKHSWERKILSTVVVTSNNSRHKEFENVFLKILYLVMSMTVQLKCMYVCVSVLYTITTVYYSLFFLQWVISAWKTDSFSSVIFQFINLNSDGRQKDKRGIRGENRGRETEGGERERERE